MWRDRSGVAAVEFALVAPVLVLMMLGVFEETELIRAQMKVSHAAGLLVKMVAQQVTTVSGGTSGTLGNLCKGAQMTVVPLAATGLAAAIASVSTSASGTGKSTAMDWESDSSCAKTATALGSAGAVSLATSTGLVPDAGDSLIIVKATYNYTAVSHVVLSATYSLTQTAYGRPRGNVTLACSNC